MLRVKSGVLLSELEKFGFQFHTQPDWWVIVADKNYVSAYVDTKNRRLEVFDWDNNIDLIFDLIKNGILEKVPVKTKKAKKGDNYHGS